MYYTSLIIATLYYFRCFYITLLITCYLVIWSPSGTLLPGPVSTCCPPCLLLIYTFQSQFYITDEHMLLLIQLPFEITCSYSN